jgi:hypothetical protein
MAEDRIEVDIGTSELRAKSETASPAAFLMMAAYVLGCARKAAARHHAFENGHLGW